MLPATGQDSPVSPTNATLPDAPSSSLSPSQSELGTVHGVVVDRDGNFIPNAHITLSYPRASTAANEQRPQQSLPEIISSEDGSFSFNNVPPGSFELNISAPQFAPMHVAGILQSGQSYEVPELSLIPAASIETQVTASVAEVAQAEVHEQEKQRVLGLIPNFYVSYLPDPAPMTPKQKLQLGWKTLIDPVSFGITGAIAGAQMAANSYPGYGQGALGYSKYYAAAYGNFLTGTLVGDMILPIALKQDPRFFYKADGSVPSRIWYSMKAAVLCKGDNGHWQFNYSGVGGSVAAGFIANAYYPTADRSNGSVIIEQVALGTAGNVASNLFQEFLIPRLTPHKPPTASRKLSD